MTVSRHYVMHFCRLVLVYCLMKETLTSRWWSGALVLTPSWLSVRFNVLFYILHHSNKITNWFVRQPCSGFLFHKHSCQYLFDSACYVKLAKVGRYNILTATCAEIKLLGSVSFAVPQLCDVVMELLSVSLCFLPGRQLPLWTAGNSFFPTNLSKLYC